MWLFSLIIFLAVGYWTKYKSIFMKTLEEKIKDQDYKNLTQESKAKLKVARVDFWEFKNKNDFLRYLKFEAFKLGYLLSMLFMLFVVLFITEVVFGESCPVYLRGGVLSWLMLFRVIQITLFIFKLQKKPKKTPIEIPRWWRKICSFSLFESLYLQLVVYVPILVLLGIPNLCIWDIFSLKYWLYAEVISFVAFQFVYSVLGTTLPLTTKKAQQTYEEKVKVLEEIDVKTNLKDIENEGSMVEMSQGPKLEEKEQMLLEPEQKVEEVEINGQLQIESMMSEHEELKLHEPDPMPLAIIPQEPKQESNFQIVENRDRTSSFQ